MSSSSVLSDQAKELRRIVELRKQEMRLSGKLRTIAVVSGKGGVGKSNLSVNVAYAMAEQGHKVVLLDADLGLANVDILCGVTAKYNLTNLIDGNKNLDDILLEISRNLWILPGGSGIKELVDLSETQLSELINSLGALEDRFDVLIVDTGAGINRNVLSFAMAADTTLLVTTPEPSAIRDAYGVLKALISSFSGGKKNDISILVNMAASESEGFEVANRISTAASHFLGLPINYMGCIMKDDSVGRAVRLRKPFYQLYPKSFASEGIRKLVFELIGTSSLTVVNSTPPRGLKAFFFRLTRGYLA